MFRLPVIVHTGGGLDERIFEAVVTHPFWSLIEHVYVPTFVTFMHEVVSPVFH
jgi:hypothetical protein